MTCKHCGQEIPDGVQYCGSCGTRVGRRKSSPVILLIAAVVILGLVVALPVIGGESPALREERETTAPVTEPMQDTGAEELPDEILLQDDYSDEIDSETALPEDSQTYQDSAPPLGINATGLRDPSIPAEFRDNILITYRNAGSCEKMVGDVVVTIVFTDVPEGQWTEQARAELEKGLQEEAQRMMDMAAEYGTELNLQLEFLETTAPSCEYSQEETWAESALENLNLAPLRDANLKLEERYDVDAAPLIFYLNISGRSRACWHNQEDAREFAILYMGADALLHEMSHLFGAVDYYYPQLVEDHASRLFPDSLMASSEARTVDPMTAYLIGWTDELSPDAEEFLRCTNELTWETYMEELSAEYVTGYVTKEYDYGTYTGYLVDGVKEGTGKLVWTSGTVYEGDWYYGNMHGFGTMTWPDGMTYSGQWANGKRNGDGTLIWASGVSYEGQWVDDQRQGFGMMFWLDGAVYEGQWENDQRTGKGKLSWPDGAYYEGDWVDGVKSGYGVMVWADGTRYEGQWENNQRHGQGTTTWPSGNVQSGRYENGEFVG